MGVLRSLLALALHSRFFFVKGSAAPSEQAPLQGLEVGETMSTGLDRNRILSFDSINLYYI